MEYTVESILKRRDSLNQYRDKWTGLWEELIRYILPRKGFGLEPGTEATQFIMDGTPTDALAKLSSVIISLLNADFEVCVKNKDLQDSEVVKEWFRNSTKTMKEALKAEDTCYLLSLYELVTDLCLLNTACMYIAEDADAGVFYKTIPLNEIAIAENSKGQVDTVFRTYTQTLRQAQQDFPDGLSKESMDKIKEGKLDTEIEILHAVFPRSDRDPLAKDNRNMPFASLYIEVKAKHLLNEGGYEEFPYAVPRQDKNSGEVYGRGASTNALPDIRQLNAVRKSLTQAIQKQAEPAMQAPDDGFMEIDTRPGGVSYYRAGSSDRLEHLPPPLSVRDTREDVMDLRGSVRQYFLNDQLDLRDSAQMTAKEVAIRDQRNMRILAPTIMRLLVEYKSRVVERTFFVLMRAGKFDAVPQELEGQEFRIEHISSVVKSDKYNEIESTWLLVERAFQVAQFGKPEALDLFNFDKIFRTQAEVMSIPSDFINSEKDVEATRKDREKQQQAAAQAEDIHRTAETAEKLAGADMEGQNVLTALAEQGA